MLNELSPEYYAAIRRQDEDGDPLFQPMTALQKEKNTYSPDVVTKFNRLKKHQQKDGIGKALSKGLIRSDAPFRKQTVVLKIGGQNVRLKIDKNDKTHPADQLGAQIEQSGLFSPASQKNGYVRLYLKETDQQQRQQLNKLKWRDALREVTDKAVGPYNKALHVGVEVDPSQPKRSERIGEDPNEVEESPSDQEEEQESAVIPINIEGDGMASADNILHAIVLKIAEKTAKTVISKHSEQDPDWRPTLEAVRNDPILVRRIVVRSLHKAKPVAFPHAEPRCAFRKLGCHDPCAAVNTFSTMLTNCLASSECAPPPTICNPRFRRRNCFNPCKLKRYLCEKIRCALRCPALEWVASCARSIRARAKRFLSCYRDCRENCCALRKAEPCPDGAINQDECVEVRTVCDSSSDSDSCSSDSDSDLDADAWSKLDTVEALRLHALHKQRRHLGRAKRSIMRKFCPICHSRRSACACKRARHRSVFCKRERPVSAFDPLCPVSRGPYNCPLVSICEPIEAKFDRSWMRSAQTGIPTTPETNHVIAAPSAPTQPSVAPAQQQDVYMGSSSAAKQLNFVSDEEEDDDLDAWDSEEDGEAGEEGGEYEYGDDDDAMDVGGKYTDFFKNKARKVTTKAKDAAFGKSKAYRLDVVLVDSEHPRGVSKSVYTRYRSNLKRMFVIRDGQLSELEKIAKDNRLTIQQKASKMDNILDKARRVKNQAEATRILEKQSLQVRVGDDYDEDEGEGDAYEYGENFMWDDRFEKNFNERKRKQETADSDEDEDVEYGKRKRTRDQIGDLISDGFELNSVEHARYATAKTDKEIYSALKSALDRSGSQADHMIIQSILDTNRDHTKHVAEQVSAEFTPAELADEKHIGWAMGRYWAAHLNRTRILGWNRFAEWYNKRSCTRKLCILPVPPCPVKPNPCNPCKAAADPCGGTESKCKLTAGSSEEKKEESEGEEEGDSDDGDSESDEENEEEGEDEQPEQSEQVEQPEIEEYVTCNTCGGLTPKSKTQTKAKSGDLDEWNDSDEDEDEEYVECNTCGGSKTKAQAGDSDDDFDEDSDEEELEAAAIRARIHAAKTAAAASTASSSSSPTLAPHKFKVDKFVSAMKSSGADTAFDRFNSPNVDVHMVMLHDEHPSQQRVIDALQRAAGNKILQRKILGPMTVFAPRNSDGSMQSMNNAKATAKDGKSLYEFSRGGEYINGKPAGPPVDMRTGARPLSYSSAVKLVYPVADFSH